MRGGCLTNRTLVDNWLTCSSPINAVSVNVASSAPPVARNPATPPSFMAPASGPRSPKTPDVLTASRVDMVYAVVAPRAMGAGTEGRSDHVTRMVAAAGFAAYEFQAVEGFDAQASGDCLQRLYRRDRTIIFANRTQPVQDCGMAHARAVGVTPFIDPGVAWPGNEWDANGILVHGDDSFLRKLSYSAECTAGPGSYNRSEGCHRIEAPHWRKSQFAAAVSHASVWQKISRHSGNNWSLVIEDDAFFLPTPAGRSFRSTLEQVLARVPPDCLFVHVSLTEAPVKIQNRDPKQPLVMPGSMWGLVAYAMRPLGARRLLQRAAEQSIIFPLDKQPPPNPGFKIKLGISVPSDFVTILYARRWLGAHWVNRARAVAEGLLLNYTCGNRQTDGLAVEDRGAFGSVISGTTGSQERQHNLEHVVPCTTRWGDQKNRVELALAERRACVL